MASQLEKHVFQLARGGKFDDALEIIARAQDKMGMLSYTFKQAGHRKNKIAVQMLREAVCLWGIPLSLTVCNSMVYAFRAIGNPRFALSLVHNMMKDGKNIDAYTGCEVISCCAALGWWQTALDFYHKTLPAKNVAYNEYISTSLIHCLNSSGQPRKALREYQRQIASGNPVSSRTTCEAISACKADGQCELAISLIAGVPARERDTHSYTSVLAACNSAQEYRKALEVWDEMRTHGLVPTEVTIGALLTACLGLRDARKAILVLEFGMLFGCRLDDSSVRTLRQMLSKGVSGPERAQLEELICKLNPDTALNTSPAGHRRRRRNRDHHRAEQGDQEVDDPTTSHIHPPMGSDGSLTFGASVQTSQQPTFAMPGQGQGSSSSHMGFTSLISQHRQSSDISPDSLPFTPPEADINHSGASAVAPSADPAAQMAERASQAAQFADHAQMAADPTAQAAQLAAPTAQVAQLALADTAAQAAQLIAPAAQATQLVAVPAAQAAQLPAPAAQATQLVAAPAAQATQLVAQATQLVAQTGPATQLIDQNAQTSVPAVPPLIALPREEETGASLGDEIENQVALFLSGNDYNDDDEEDE